MTYLKPVTKLSEIQKWCKPISDDQARQFISQPEIHNLRLFSKETLNWDENIFYKVEPGFDFQEHAPKIGPCRDDWQTQRQWKLKNKESTCDSLVFWIPRLLPNVYSETIVDRQKRTANYYRKKYNLPENCLNNFGSASLNALLILERFHRTNGSASLDCYWIRTDTLYVNGQYLYLGLFGEVGLCCGSFDWWNWAVGEDANLGCFPSGVWKLKFLG